MAEWMTMTIAKVGWLAIQIQPTTPTTAVMSMNQGSEVVGPLCSLQGHIFWLTKALGRPL